MIKLDTEIRQLSSKKGYDLLWKHNGQLIRRFVMCDNLAHRYDDPEKTESLGMCCPYHHSSKECLQAAVHYSDSLREMFRNYDKNPTQRKLKETAS